MGFIERLSGLFDRGGTETPDGAATSETAPTAGGDAEDTDTAETAAPPTDAGAASEADGATDRGATRATGATDEGSSEATDGADPTATFAEQAAALAADNPDLDGSLDSLAAADRVADASEADETTVLALGSYFGETLLSAHDGDWTKPEGGTWAVVLEGGETDVTLNAFQLAAEAIRGPTTFAATYRAVERRL